jgi:hypothetical protein
MEITRIGKMKEFPDLFMKNLNIGSKRPPFECLAIGI